MTSLREPSLDHLAPSPTPRGAPSRPGATSAAFALPALFTAVIFLNASLLFIVQPLFSKLALPLLGGAPAVWNTSMLVFQSLLLGGYLYAHLTSRWLRPRPQLALHATLLALSLLALPIGIRAGWASPAEGAPVPWLVMLILLGLGAPFLLLSTGAPLLQQWFARTDHPDAADPYFLYAASNAGSLLALLSYPFLVEPLIGLKVQRYAWSAAYAFTTLLIVVCGAVALRWAARRPTIHGEQSVTISGPVEGQHEAPVRNAEGGVARGRVSGALNGAASSATDRASELSAAAGVDAGAQAVRWRSRLWWVLLSFAPSSLLLGVTTYLSTDVAVVPLLWVVPLALYLLTFIIAFARRRLIAHELALRLQPMLLLPLVAIIFAGRAGDVRVMAPMHLLLFFVTALVCHGELARLRPGAAHLTDFYLWLSVGGVLGGVFNVLIAPMLFDRVLEYQIILALACAVRPWPSTAGVRGRRQLLGDLLFPLALGVLVVAALRYPGDWHPLLAMYAVPAIGATGAVVCALFVRRPLRLGLGVLALLVAGWVGGATGKRPMVTVRSFFGAYSVQDLGNGYHSLKHGSTLHGAQNLRPEHAREPLTYFGLRGPLGDIVGAARLAGRPLAIGVVGLGTGSVACFARPGDHFTFYEIDPLVATLARDKRLFTYLENCTPDVPIIIGDARLSLERDSAVRYDVLILDAFSSDAIPVHLLTREAMKLYLSRLTPSGVLAIHISNRYLNLRPAVANLAADAGVPALLGEDRRLPRQQLLRMYSASVWIAVTHDSALRESLDIRDRWEPLLAPAGERVWTDDYSNVLGALIRRSRAR